MKKVMLFGALIALFASSNLYAATCVDTGTDTYTDDCEAEVLLNLPQFAVIQFPAAAGADGSDLNVVWDGTAASATNSINICIGTNSTTDIDVTTTSVNGFEVTDGTTTVPYTLDLNTTIDLTSGPVVFAKADADNLTCANSVVPLTLGFLQTDLQTTDTDGTAFVDTVTIIVAPQ